MRAILAAWHRIVTLFRRGRLERDFNEEVLFHLAMREEEALRAGASASAARSAARRHFGNVTIVKERMRDEWTFRWVETAWQDIRHTLRIMRKAPLFTCVAVTTLALGIGANTAIFSVANALFFTPLPVLEPHALVRVYSGESRMSWPNYLDVTSRNDVFDGVAAHRSLTAGLAADSPATPSNGEVTSANFFSVLGTSAVLGRTFTAADRQSDLVVIADHLWRSAFDANPAVIGRVLQLDGRRHQILGVMPPTFRGVAPPGLRQDFWIPADATSGTLQDRTLPQFEVVARLKDGAALESATAAMRTLARQITTDHPDVRDSFAAMEVFPIQGLAVYRGMAGIVIPVFAFLGLLAVMSGLLLAITCTNLAGLLLSRAVARRHEIAIRLSLGAARARIVRQLLTESLLLALLGGGIGALAASWLIGGVNLFLAQFPVPVQFDLAIDGRVLAYTLMVATAAALMFGLAPASRATRVDLVTSLKAEHGGTFATQRLGRALVIGQVALATVLLVWSGLFVRSLAQVNEVDPGFDPEGVLLATVTLDEASKQESARHEQTFLELQRRVEQAAGVESAGMSLIVPLTLLGREEFSVSKEDGQNEAIRYRIVANRLTPGWFRTLRIPMLTGRDFGWDDREGTPPVAVVNETLARQVFNGSALGQRLTWGVGTTRTVVEVVGVVGDTKYNTLGEVITPTVYLPFRQQYRYMMTLSVRAADMQATATAIRRELQQLAPGVSVDIRPMTQAVGIATLPARIGAILTGAFASVTMLLAGIGVYGLVAFTVVQRRREIGVRRALGAHPVAIVRLIMADTAKLTASGLAVGLGMGVLGAFALRGFMVGVSPIDLATLVPVAVLVMAATLAASALPAINATRVDPLVTLRHD